MPIVQKLIEYFNEELIIVSEQQNEDEKNAKAYVEFTKNIQKYLAGIGYLDIKQIDGDYGPTTDKAVDKWRNERGNPNKTGKIEENSQEFKLLEKHYNKRIERLDKWQDIKSDVIKYFDLLGYKTKNLEKTIKNFQKDYNLEVTGSFFDKKNDEFNDALFNKLKEEYQNKKNKKNEVLSEVKNIQKYLQLLGFYSEEIDGVLGKGTIKAIKKWEKKNNTESLIKEDESLDKKVLKKLRNNYEEIDEEINSIRRKLDKEKDNFNNLNKELKKYFGEIIELQNEIDNFKSVFLEKSNLPQLANIEDISELNSYSDNLNDLLKFIESFDKQIDDTKQNINALDFENVNNIYKNIYKEDIKNNLPSSYSRNILYNEYKKELDIEIINTQKISNIEKLDDIEKDILAEYYLKIDTNKKALSDREEQLESSLPLILIIAGGIVLIAGGVLLFIFNRNQSSKTTRTIRKRITRKTGKN